MIIGYAVSSAEYGFCTVYVADNVSDSFGLFLAYVAAAVTVAATAWLAWCCPDGQWNTTNPRAKHVLLTACWVSAYAVWYPWVATVKLWAGFGVQAGLLGIALTSTLRVVFSLALGALVSVLLSKSFTMTTVALSKWLVAGRHPKSAQSRAPGSVSANIGGDLSASLLAADADAVGASAATREPTLARTPDGDAWYDDATGTQHEADSAEALLHRLLVSAPTMLGVDNPAEVDAGVAARSRAAAAAALVQARESHTAGWSAGGYEVVDIG